MLDDGDCTNTDCITIPPYVAGTTGSASGLRAGSAWTAGAASMGIAGLVAAVLW